MNRETFKADYNNRLPVEQGSEIKEKGERLGEGTYVKDCYWSGYKYKDEYFLSVNDYDDSFWKASKEDVDLYIRE